MKKKKIVIIILAILLMGTGIAIADDVGGILNCVGRHVDGSVNASFLLSNFNDNKYITINHIVVYDPDGNVVCTGPYDPILWECGPGVECFPARIAPNGATWLGVHRMIRYEWCPGIEDVHWVNLKFEYTVVGGRSGDVPLSGRTTEVGLDRRGDPVGRANLKCDTVQFGSSP